MNDETRQALFLIADEIRGKANLAMHFAVNHYEAERGHDLLGLAAQVAALAEDAAPPSDETLQQMQHRFEHTGLTHVSPIAAVDAAVFNADDEILLIERADGKGWAMPGGLAELGMSIPQSTLKELWEEAGMRGEVVQLLGVFNGPDWSSQSSVQLANIVFEVRCDDLTPSAGIEATDIGFFPLDSLPSHMHLSHRRRIPVIVEMRATGGCYFDPAASADLDLSDFQRPSGSDDT